MHGCTNASGFDLRGIDRKADVVNGFGLESGRRIVFRRDGFWASWFLLSATIDNSPSMANQLLSLCSVIRIGEGVFKDCIILNKHIVVQLCTFVRMQVELIFEEET